jgi:hypothetical protein
MKNDNPLVINIKNEIFVVGWFSKNARAWSKNGKEMVAMPVVAAPVRKRLRVIIFTPL